MGFRLYSLFQWGTNTWAVLCLKVLRFVFRLLLLVKHRFCCVFQLHFHWEVKLPNHELQKVLAIDHHSVDQISLAKTTQQICACLSVVLSSKSIPVPILGSKNPFFFLIEAGQSMLPDTSHPTAFRISCIPSIHSSSDQVCLTFTPQDINFSPLIPLHSGSKLCPVPKLILSVRFFLVNI